MPVVATLLNIAGLLVPLLLLVIGCRSHPIENVQAQLARQPTIDWKTDIDWDEAHTTVRGGKVWLVVDSRPFLVSDTAVAQYSAIDRKDYAARKVPPQALSAAEAWWAGNGEIFYVIQQNHNFVVYSREESEVGSENAVHPVKLIPSSAIGD